MTVILCLICLVTANPGIADSHLSTVAGGAETEQSRLLDQAVTEFMEQYSVPALSIAIHGGSINYTEAFGMADLEFQVPATTTTLFRTASIAKPLTATAVLKLSDDGLLDLDAPIQTYCPAFPVKRWPVTARLLMGHMGGIRHYRSGEVNGTEHYFSVEDSLETFRDDPLDYEPGTKFQYSTFGYSILGCAIEGASERTYEQYLFEAVFEPAGMVSTTKDDHFLIQPGRASGYMRIDESDLRELPPAFASQLSPGQVLNAMLHDTSMKIPGGGLLSTPSDLMRFVTALRQGRLVAKDSLDLMWRSSTKLDGAETGYGLGWDLETIEEQKAIFHKGSQSGASGGLYVFPQRNLQLAVLTNLANCPIQQLVTDIIRILGE